MSTYSGQVTVGGPADIRELPALTISKIAVGPTDNNAYLLRCRSTGDALLIDAADEVDRLVELAGDRQPTAVLTTHRHGDHWRALAAFVERTGARTIAHQLDADALPVPVDQTVEHGETVWVGKAPVTITHLRGHTPGSIAVRYEDPAGHPHLITGDSLFPGGPGNTEGDQERFASLMGNLEERVFGILPDETWVYPGHGYDTTLGAERPHIPEWRGRGW